LQYDEIEEEDELNIQTEEDEDDHNNNKIIHNPIVSNNNHSLKKDNNNSMSFKHNEEMIIHEHLNFLNKNNDRE